jgi:hypothetical protein
MGRADTPLLAPFVTIAMDAGRQDKLRPGDLLGALTGDAGLPATAVGKIDVFPTRTYVAIAREWHQQGARAAAGRQDQGSQDPRAGTGRLAPGRPKLHPEIGHCRPGRRRMIGQ